MATPQHTKQTLFGSGVKRLELSIPKIVELADNTRWSDAFSLDEIEAMAEYMLPYQADKDAIVVKEGSKEAFLCLLQDVNYSTFTESR